MKLTLNILISMFGGFLIRINHPNFLDNFFDFFGIILLVWCDILVESIIAIYELRKSE